MMDDNVEVRYKILGWPEAVRKGKFMHMGLSQMEARILRVKLHRKLTSIISVALNKGQMKDYRDGYSILTALF